MHTTRPEKPSIVEQMKRSQASVEPLTCKEEPGIGGPQCSVGTEQSSRKRSRPLMVFETETERRIHAEARASKYKKNVILLEKKVKHLKFKVNRMEEYTEKSKMHRRVKQVERDMRAMTTKVKDELKNIAEIKGRLTNAIKFNETEVVRIKLELKDAKDLCISKESTTEELRTHLGSMSSIISQYQKDLESKDRESKTIRIKKEKLTEEIDENRAELRKLERKLEKRKSQVDNLSSDIDDLKNEVNYYKDVYNNCLTQVNSLKEEELMLQEKIGRKDDYINSLEVRLSSLGVKTTSDSGISDMNQLFKENRELKTRNENLIEREHAVKSQKCDMINERQTRENRIKELSNMVKSLRSKNSRIESELHLVKGRASATPPQQCLTATSEDLCRTIVSEVIEPIFS